MFYLQSKATDKDDYFYNSIVCITENNAEGAVGFVINRSYPRSLNALQEFAHLPSFPLYEGGPVDSVHLYFIHRRPDIVEGGKPVSGNIYFGGDFKQAASAITKGIFNQNDIRIFLGYCGWDAGELEDEMKEDDWEIIEANVFLF